MLEVALPPPPQHPPQPPFWSLFLSAVGVCRIWAPTGHLRGPARSQREAQTLLPLFQGHCSQLHISNFDRVWIEPSCSQYFVIYMGVKRLNPDIWCKPPERLSTVKQYLILTSLWWQTSLQFHRTRGWIRTNGCETRTYIYVCIYTYKTTYENTNISTYVPAFKNFAENSKK